MFIAGGCQHYGMSLPTDAFVARVETTAQPAPVSDRAERWMLMRDRADVTRFVLFAWFRSEKAARAVSNEVYRTVVMVPGSWSKEPRFAAFAEWRLQEEFRASAFIENRKQLFELRARHIETFHADWLLQHVDDSSRYLVLGLYAAASGLEQARGHEDIRRFAQANPPALLTASDIYGVRNLDMVARAGKW
jgi:hypothetical protein